MACELRERANLLTIKMEKSNRTLYSTITYICEYQLMTEFVF